MSKNPKRMTNARRVQAYARTNRQEDFRPTPAQRRRISKNRRKGIGK